MNTPCCPLCGDPIGGTDQALEHAVRVCPPCWAVLARFLRNRQPVRKRP